MDMARTLIGIAALGGLGYFTYKLLSNPRVCTEGTHSTRNGQCYTCTNNHWTPDAPVICDPTIGCDIEGEEQCASNHYLYRCIDGIWVNTQQSCVNPCDLVGPCFPPYQCDDQNNMYEVDCDPATGECGKLVLIAPNAPSCIDHSPKHIEVTLRSTGESIITSGGARPVVSNFYRNELLWNAVRSPWVGLKVRVLDSVYRAVPNVKVTITQAPTSVGGFVINKYAGGRVSCSGYTTIETGADGVVQIDPTWVCLKDQGFDVNSAINWRFTCGDAVVQGGVTHHSVGALSMAGLGDGSPCCTEEGACGWVPPFNQFDWCFQKENCSNVGCL